MLIAPPPVQVDPGLDELALLASHVFAPEVVVWAYEGSAEHPAPRSLEIPRHRQRPVSIQLPSASQAKRLHVAVEDLGAVAADVFGGEFRVVARNRSQRRRGPPAVDVSSRRYSRIRGRLPEVGRFPGRAGALDKREQRYLLVRASASILLNRSHFVIDPDD